MQHSGFNNKKGLISATILLTMLLSACGQRGPLYLPEDKPANDTQQVNQN